MANPAPGTLRHALTNWRVVAGGVLLLLLAIAAVFAPWLAPYDPLDQDLAAQLAAPDWHFGADAHALGTGLWSVVAAIVLIDWTRFCRVVRAETLKQRRLDYVDAAVVAGLRPLAILWREIVPNVLPLALVLLTLEMGLAVVIEAILSFVGLSISSDAPSWGGMIAEGREVVHQAPWVLIGAMLVLLATVLGFNVLGDGLKQELDPVLR